MPAMSEVGSVPADIAGEEVAAGRAALGRHAWQEAYDHFQTADAARPLSGPELEDLAESAFFVARADDEAEAKERAFKVYEAAGDTQRAAFIALNLTRTTAIRASARSPRSGCGGPSDSSARAAIRTSTGTSPSYGARAPRATGDIDRALELAEQAISISQRAEDADLRAHALSNLGELKIATGETADGMALMEEATVSAVNGELTPFTTGITACRTIGACRNLTDYQRATEWIEATERYCERQSLSGFPGICRIHRAEVAAVGGAWERAEQELERATHELDGYNAVPPQADGWYAIGDIRRLRGDFDGAEAALREAHAKGRTPQPAMALIRLAQGNAKGAAKMLDAALAETTTDQWARARLLPARVEVALAAGDDPAARAAVDELGTIVAGYPSPALEAGREVAHGRVLLAEGDAAGAVRELRTGIRRWREVGAPYEVARAQFVLSRALRGVQDDEDADLELRAALDEFRRLGAQTDIGLAERETHDVDERRSGPIAARMTFMFTDIVGSTNLAEEMGDDAWGRLLRWHDDTLRALIAPPRRRGRQVDGRRVLRGVRIGAERRRGRDRDPAGTPRDPGPVAPGPDRPAHGRRESPAAVTTAAPASTWRRGWPHWPAAGRSSPRPRPSPRPDPRSRDGPGCPATTTLKGVTKPVDLVGISWA